MKQAVAGRAVVVALVLELVALVLELAALLLELVALVLELAAQEPELQMPPVAQAQKAPSPI